MGSGEGGDQSQAVFQYLFPRLTWARQCCSIRLKSQAAARMKARVPSPQLHLSRSSLPVQGKWFPPIFLQPRPPGTLFPGAKMSSNCSTHTKRQMIKVQGSTWQKSYPILSLFGLQTSSYEELTTSGDCLSVMYL